MHKSDLIKTAFAMTISYICAKLSALAPVLIILAIAMLVDYFSGMIAAGLTGELNSRLGVKGILKKLSYLLAIAVAILFDQLIVFSTAQFDIQLSFQAIFSMLTSVWFILNELLSILENLGRIGTPLPKFLKNAIAIFAKKVDEADTKTDNKTDE